MFYSFILARMVVYNRCSIRSDDENCEILTYLSLLTESGFISIRRSYLTMRKYDILDYMYVFFFWRCLSELKIKSNIIGYLDLNSQRILTKHTRYDETPGSDTVFL